MGDRETAQQPFEANTLRKMSKGEKQHHMVMMDTPPPTAPPPAQQLNVMALPSYSEAVSGPVPLAGPTVASPVIQKPLVVLPGVEFGPEPVQLSCWSCHRQIVTDVTSEMTSSGMCLPSAAASSDPGWPLYWLAVS